MQFSAKDGNAKYDPLVENAESIVHLFEVLADEANYPLFFHCSIGTDRTGMVAYLINGLCGVSDDDLLRDYLFSDFATIGWIKQPTHLTRSTYYQHIKKAPGETLAERIYHCMTEIGVPAEQLDKVIQIMTE